MNIHLDEPSDKTQPAAPPQARKRALLICNGDFESLHLKLPGVAKDAVNLSKLLGDPERAGFEITLLLNEGLLAVRKGIAAACAESDISDTLLIYLSGGSCVAPQRSLLIPVADTDLNYLAATSIEPDFILSEMRQSRCKRFVLIVDVCHSGALFMNNRGIPDGLIAITSCSDSEVSADTPDGGAFTQSFIRALNSPGADRDRDGGITVDDVYDFIRKDELFMGKQSEGPPIAQHPQKWVWNLPEPIVLVRSTECVFLSYSTADSKHADAFVDAFCQTGISIWRDITGVPGGTQWRDSLVESLGKSQAMILLMSKNAMESIWVKRELEFADKRSLPIFPVMIEDFTPPDWFDFQFGAIQRQTLDLNNLNSSVNTLASNIRRMISEPRAQKPST